MNPDNENKKKWRKPLPLEGVKCVCLTTFQQGPVCFAHFADFGAEVIKIEEPVRGDAARFMFYNPQLSPLSPYFETNNRGVKSITLNIRHPKSTEILHKLIKQADIFGENYRHGVAERHGFGYEDLKTINPGLVYLSMTAYGPDGPNASLSGTDPVGQAVSGIADAFSQSDGVKSIGRVSLADENAAMTAFAAAMVGLYHKRITGEGQKIELSLLGGQIRLHGWWMTRYLMTGESMLNPLNPAGPVLVRSFNDRNGKPFIIQINSEDRWQRAIKALGFDKMLAEIDCCNLAEVASDKSKHTQFFDLLNRMLATNTREHWLRLLHQADIISAPINTLAEAAADPDVIANKYIIEVDHPVAGKIKEVGFPWKFSETPPSAGVAPELGGNNNEIYASLGYSADEISRLKKEGII
jgi:crotonobetainyl-CoA:carnitine CoA-transferase CaiB-like acyl-CoA transferase